MSKWIDKEGRVWELTVGEEVRLPVAETNVGKDGVVRVVYTSPEDCDLVAAFVAEMPTYAATFARLLPSEQVAYVRRVMAHCGWRPQP